MKKSLLASFGEFLLFLGIVALGGFGVSMLMGSSTDGDKTVFALPYETMGQKHWFATPAGTGDCTSWNHACTFRTAVGKCSSAVRDVIYVGAGIHDLDNGADANGTTISVDNVSVVGVANSWTGGPRMVNGDAAAVYVLRSTGDGFLLRSVYFDNTGQTDEDVTFLNIQADRAMIENSTFVQEATAGAGVGILFDNSASNAHLHYVGFEGIIDEAIKTNGFSHLHAEYVSIDGCGTGVSVAGASDSYVDFEWLTIKNSTLGVGITGATVTYNLFKHVHFVHNTTNIADVTAYDDTHWQDISADHLSTGIYPADAGVAVSTGDGAWVWTAAATQIIPADTINNPFFITQVNLQAYDASQTFKIEIFWGETAADNAMDCVEFTVGAAVQASFVPLNLEVNGTPIPAGSYIGVKAKSSTGGVDSLTLTLSYVEL